LAANLRIFVLHRSLEAMGFVAFVGDYRAGRDGGQSITASTQSLPTQPNGQVPHVSLPSRLDALLGRFRPVLNGAHGILDDASGTHLAEENLSRETR
jgi:hypothetical protein